MVRFCALLALIAVPVALAARVEQSGPWTLKHPRNSRWPAALNGNYTEIRRLTCGMHGCAFLATENGSGNQVVIKLSDEDAIEQECGEMRWLRFQACKTSEELLRLHETYIPDCMDFGKLPGHRRYMVLPMAGPSQIGKLQRNHTLTPFQEKTYFAQMVAGLYGLHAAGYRHLDLNGGNLILDGDRLAVIDFGLLERADCTGRCRRGMSRDANGVYRWAAVLADCPADARFKKAWWVNANIRAQRVAQKKAMKCIQDRWEPDALFLSVLERVFNGNLELSEEQHLAELYKTGFVQDHLPQTSVRFQSPGTKGCVSWTPEQFQHAVKETGAVDVK